MDKQNYTLETVIRSDEDILHPICSTNFNLLHGHNALRDHSEKLTEIVEEDEAMDDQWQNNINVEFWETWMSSKNADIKLEQYQERVGYLEVRIDDLQTKISELRDERDDLMEQKSMLQMEHKTLREELSRQESETEEARQQIAYLEKRLDEVVEERNNLLQMEDSEAIVIIRQWMQYMLLDYPGKLTQKLLDDGVTSQEITAWAEKEGYDTTPRSLGNTISKHPRLNKIFLTKDDSKPAKWLIDIDRISEGELKLIFGTNAFVERFIDHTG